MTIIRVMTYNVQGCRGGDRQVDPERIVRVIGESGPDIVALQQVDATPDNDQVGILAERLRMRRYGLPRRGANAFLSHFPLKGVQEFELAEGGCCLRADADIHNQRVHLFNLRLDSAPLIRRRQIAALLGPDLLGSSSLACPTMVLGDFGDLFWGAGNLNLTLVLRKARRPLWSSTYPASFPLAGRDRAYLRGELHIVDSSICRSPTARQASSHLPLTLTVQVADPRSYLRLEKMNANQMKIAPG
ncbi:MAG: endonuclease/exonuclease/phosphatase family protein [Desulfuromonadales bacterium]